MPLLNSDLGRENVREWLKKSKTVYFVGIGGMSMSAIAAYYCEKEYRVCGCDRILNKNTEWLISHGAIVTVPEPNCLPNDVDILIYTLALDENHPLLAEARRKNIPTVSRAELLGTLMEEFPTAIAVAGSHGKSTVTALLSYITEKAGLNPLVIGGADLGNGRNFRLGNKRLMITEACEYRESFLSLSPTLGIVLNIDYDHPDYYTDSLQFMRAFQTFMTLPRMKNCITPTTLKGSVCFSVENPGADIHAADITYKDGYASFTPIVFGEAYERISLSLPGRHSVCNVLAAVMGAILSGVPAKDALRYAAEFKGIAGRLQFCGYCNGAKVYNDYAHHPTEIEASLATLRSMAKGRLLCVFQSHTYTRTKAYYDAFMTALHGADTVFIADIYAARETDTLGMSGEKMAREFGGIYVPSPDTAAKTVAVELVPGDILVVMGAGDFQKMIDCLPITESDTK